MDDKMKMRMYVAEFGGHYLGAYAVIIDSSKEEAFNQLKKRLEGESYGHDLKIDDLYEIPYDEKHVHIIWDGNY